MRNFFKTTNRTLHIKVLLVMLAFLAMVTLSYISMSRVVRGNLVDNAGYVLDVAEMQTSYRLREFESVMEGFAIEMRRMVLRGDTAPMLEEYINDISKSFVFGNRELSGIYGFYGYIETLPDGPALITKNSRGLSDIASPKESALYQLAVEAAGSIVVTTPVICNTNETLCTYAKCIFDDQGKRLGVICMDVNISEIGRKIVDIALNHGGYGMLMDQDFMTMFHPNPDFVGINMYNPAIPVHIFADDLRNGKEVFDRPLTSYKNESSIAFFRKLPSGWYMGLVTPKKRYYASMDTMARELSALGTVLAMILIGIMIRIEIAKTKSDDESKKKSMFLANMSHEIRTPINAIVGMTAIGMATGAVNRKDYCFSKIDNATKHLLGVVNDILDISKIEANKIELSPVDFDFERMLQQAVNVVNFRVDEKHQKLMVRIDKSIPKNLFADDQRLAQIITNLLSNAIKFTPDWGDISLKTSLVGEDNGLFTIKMEVADNGIGISQEQQGKLFRPFQQAESFTTRKYGGTGLGLAISKSIVELMGGKIWVESEFGKGATFAFTVKVKQGKNLHPCLGSNGVHWKNIRILTVDDDPDILLYFKEIVSGFGSRCDCAGSAEEALEMIEHNGDYNIYFVDLRMPGTDGISLTRKIREKESKPGSSVVIMISSAELSAMESEAKKVGVNKFLLKPLFPSAISDVIGECIGVINDKNEDASLDINGVFAGRRILLAEDVNINCEIVLTLLKPTLMEIDCAENGIEAVSMFSKAPEKYDMIFMDIQMPEMDGFEATRQIRALEHPKAATVPIVAMTANVFKEDIKNCLAAGMNGHLGKPLDMDAMLKILFKYLHRLG
ncbi:MAG: response regulator [Deltaproteobacteria bacterium]|jgi:signal transduction histidine kinase/DNA-binding response OmpR family regulator|nr:response regulator [Deltaproteobacteria bacterium]